MTNRDHGELTGGKPIVKSKSFWGHLLQLVPLIDLAASAAGYPGAISGTISIISGAIGGVLGIWGTAARKEKITSVL